MGGKKIFFSYSRVDGSEFALKLANDLRRAGANVWIDQLDIPAGKVWDIEIENALENSQAVICIVSERSSTSNNVLNEVYYAIDSNKDVVPVIIHNCKIPFRLKRLQYIDFTKDYQTSFDRLLRNLGMAANETDLSKPPVSPPVEIEPSPQTFHRANPETPKPEPIGTVGKTTGSSSGFLKGKNIYYILALVLVAALVIAFNFMGGDTNSDDYSNYESDTTTTSSGVDTTYSGTETTTGTATDTETDIKTDGTETEHESTDTVPIGPTY